MLKHFLTDVSVGVEKDPKIRDIGYWPMSRKYLHFVFYTQPMQISSKDHQLGRLNIVKTLYYNI